MSRSSEFGLESIKIIRYGNVSVMKKSFLRRYKMMKTGDAPILSSPLMRYHWKVPDGHRPWIHFWCVPNNYLVLLGSWNRLLWDWQFNPEVNLLSTVRRQSRLMPSFDKIAVDSCLGAISALARAPKNGQEPGQNLDTQRQIPPSFPLFVSLSFLPRSSSWRVVNLSFSTSY